MNDEGTAPISTSTTIFLALQHSIFFWALLVVGAIYAVLAITGHPLALRLARAGLWLFTLGTLFELGIAILWRVIFGDFSDVPTFAFSGVTLIFIGVVGASVWPWRAKKDASAETPPGFDWLRASLGLCVAVMVALALGFADAAFRARAGSPYFDFRGYAWFYFAMRGVGGAIVGGILAGILAGMLPRYLWSHRALAKPHAAVLAGALVVLAVAVRLIGGGQVG
jgi:hypothetical protein